MQCSKQMSPSMDMGVADVELDRL